MNSGANEIPYLGGLFVEHSVRKEAPIRQLITKLIAIKNNLANYVPIFCQIKTFTDSWLIAEMITPGCFYLILEAF